MTGRIKKHQRAVLVALIVICMMVIFAGGVRYLGKLRGNLKNNAIQNVMTVTAQQEQAFDSFISGDMERLHSFAGYFVSVASDDVEEIIEELKLFYEVDAEYSVVNLETETVCSSRAEGVFRMPKERMDSIRRTLPDNGASTTGTELFMTDTLFGYYECFAFSDGVRALVQKSYDRSKVSETFSLSVYNNRGFAYVVNRQGDILLRYIGMIADRMYENIFDVVEGVYGEGTDTEDFTRALENRETGSTIFSGDRGAYVYTYVPVQSVEDWYLVSIVPVSAITEETNHLLSDTRMTLAMFIFVLALCTVFVQLIWRTHKDIEEKEQEVQYQSQLFNVFSEYLSQNTDDVYMMLNHVTNEIEYASSNVLRVLGAGKDEVIDVLRDSDMESDPQAAEAYYSQVTSLKPGMTALARVTERVNPKTGEQRCFVEKAYCTEIQGRPKRVVYISDRTRERNTQNSLSEALRMAQAASEAKSAFLSSVSHDIRTPMNAIIGFLELMRSDANNPGLVMEYTQRIDAASQHLLGLINDVLDMNKIESGSASLNIAELNLAGVIDEINTIIRPQTRAKNQTFDISVSQLEHEHLMGDKLRINQILINLLSNAVKYTPEGGNIHLRIEGLPQVVDDYSRIRFAVSDNGLGMSEDYLKVIFDPFTREETKTVSEIQGTGLGMAITKSLVDLMGGSISVESEQGKGSTFTVELELPIHEMEDDPKFWGRYSVARMIVADDDEEVCQSIAKTMSRVGVETDWATDGETAVRMMREHREAGQPYDLILLDWKMPNLNGLETARLIRKNYPDRIPILLLTAYDWSDIEQEAMEIGVNHFMPKPFFMSTFRDAIRRVMGTRKDVRGAQSDIVSGKRIMVVDDIDVNRIILVKLLSALGAVCDTAENGREAADKFIASQPGEYDLIFMDVQMPEMDGYTATKTIRNSAHPSAKTVAIIAMTANAFVDDVREAIDSGMNAHIAKPVQLDKLKATIKQVLDSRDTVS